MNNPNSPDWSKAPSWAKYHAYDHNGNGYWYAEKPTLDQDNRMWKGGKKHYPHVIDRMENVDYRCTLSERPNK